MYLVCIYLLIVYLIVVYIYVCICARKKKKTNRSILVSSRKSHTTRGGGRLRVATFTAPDLSGSGRVDMLTRPAAAARDAVATGASG